MENPVRRGDAACACPFLRGSLEVQNQRAMDCIVINLSGSGAHVALADVPTVGDHALLTIPARYFQMTCKVVHRGRDDTFQLAFTPVVEPSVTIPKP